MIGKKKINGLIFILAFKKFVGEGFKAVMRFLFINFCLFACEKTYKLDTKAIQQLPSYSCRLQKITSKRVIVLPLMEHDY